jgi:hypothetical protein
VNRDTGENENNRECTRTDAKTEANRRLTQITMVRRLAFRVALPGDTGDIIKWESN